MLSSELSRQGQRFSGPLRSRVEDLKNRWRQSSPLNLSHNESARLAMDALIEKGEEGYLRALAEEKELSFLSSLDIQYIGSCMNAATSGLPTARSQSRAESLMEEDGISEQTSGTYFPLMSDLEPPMLELGWPELPHSTTANPIQVHVLFQREKSSNIKDCLRSLINKARKVIAVVMDLFTDVDILCDLVEASSKRKVPVYLLLDNNNLKYFIEMCDKMGFTKLHFHNLKVRTLTGDTYYTKSGKKFSGQSLTKFLMVDCEEVVTGSYSFSWLSGHIHSNIVIHLTGSIVEGFDQEFRYLYANSDVVDHFCELEEKNISTGHHIPIIIQPIQRSTEMYTPGLSNHSSSPSSCSVSSLKASPYIKNSIGNTVHQDKEPFAGHIVQHRRAFYNPKVNFLNQDRRQSEPHKILEKTLGLFGQQRKTNLGNLSTILSKSTPNLNCEEPTENASYLGIRSGVRKKTTGLQPEFKALPHMKSDLPLNAKITNDASQTGAADEKKEAVISPTGSKNESSSENVSNGNRNKKRSTLGHSNLDMMMKYNKMHPNPLYSRFGS
ncbi:protein FAM83C [Microcaecilia unicolor]|uniref:Protein FAM83C n=1 Tax=Microcaecilia unicolor TaxID=1415580 RepID=A0A6P7YWQ1_9AMPH|nr:protein FAM83C [Microcaecilia unicolor]